MFLLRFILLFSLTLGQAQALTIEENKHNELKAWVIKNHTNPIIGIQLTFPKGQGEDPEGKEGLTTFMQAMMDEGTLSSDATTFKEFLEDKAIEIYASSTATTFTITLITLTSQLKDALDTLEHIILHPRLEEKDIERIRLHLLAYLKKKKQRPDYCALETYRKVAYKGHFYERQLEGTEASLKGITRSDLTKHYKKLFTQEGLIVSVVGDVSEQDVSHLLALLKRVLPVPHRKTIPYPSTPPYMDGTVHQNSFSSPQATLLFYQNGLSTSDPHFYHGALLAHILGGHPLLSRLPQRAREQEGLTYGVSTTLAIDKLSPTLHGMMTTQGKKALKAIEVIRQEWQKMKENGVTEDELQAAKDYLKGAFPLTLTSTPDLLQRLTFMQMFGFSRDYLLKRNSYIDAVDLPSFNAFCKAFLSPEKLTFILVKDEVNSQ